MKRFLLFLVAALAANVFAAPDPTIDPCGRQLQRLFEAREPDAGLEPAFEHARSILMLSDGLMEGSSITLAEAVAKKYPGKKIVSGDLTHRPRHEGNVEYRKIDNCRKLPFAANSFQTIVMERGMCSCDFTLTQQNKTCGGITATVEEATRFFGEVTRVLDKQKPDSVAFLHGYQSAHFSEDKLVDRLDVWQEAAQRVMKVNPQVEIKISQFTSETFNYSFYNGIVVRVRPPSSGSERRRR